jgi:hypothetical protein
MHPVCNKALKQNCKKINFISLMQSIMFGANPTQHITEYHSSYFQAEWWLYAHMTVSRFG